MREKYMKELLQRMKVEKLKVLVVVQTEQRARAVMSKICDIMYEAGMIKTRLSFDGVDMLSGSILRITNAAEHAALSGFACDIVLVDAIFEDRIMALLMAYLGRHTAEMHAL